MTFDQMMRKEQMYWLAEGREEGILVGREEGILVGREEGQLEGRLQSARDLILQGLSCDFVANALGISMEDLIEYMEKHP